MLINIVEKMVICGAETVVGFSDNTTVHDCNLFAPAITSKLVDECLSVEDAIYDIDFSAYNKDMSEICVIAGNKNNKLR